MALLRIGATVVALLGCVASSAIAQDDLLGGWDSEVGHQAFAGQRQPQATPAVGASVQGFGGYGLSPFADRAGTSGAFGPGFGFGTVQGQHSGGRSLGSYNQGALSTASGSGTVNAMSPLVHSIRHATKRRGRSR